MTTLVVLQARMSSSRLPAKSLLPVAGYPLAVLCALRAGNAGLPVRLATSVDPSDDPLVGAARRYGTDLVRGPLDDVLGRFAGATADLRDEDLVVRITGDNALPDGAFLAELIADRDRDDEYVGTRSPVDGLPYGVRAEVFTVGILRRAAREATLPADREHVTPWIRRQTRDRLHRSTLGADYSHLRATVDTAEDHQRIWRLFDGETDPVNVRWDVLCRRLHDESPAKFRVPYRIKRDHVVSRLTLGTAQLGLERYGVANRAGRPPEDAAVGIVRTAIAHGVTSIDTARSYGLAEERIGLALTQLPAEMTRVVTKLSAMSWLDDEATLEVVRAAVERSVLASCHALRARSLDVLLLHRAAHRWSHREAVWKILLECRDRGLIRALGASVYEPDDALRLLDDPDVAHLQLPFNLFDRRWREQGVDRAIMRRPDVTIDARSAFLQGVLLLPAEQWPAPARTRAALWSRDLDRLVASYGRSSRADLCLAYVLAHDWVDSAVLGMETAAQLHENLDLVRRPPLTPDARAEIEATFPDVPIAVLDPSRWS